ncbi:hypothetical protein E8R51_21685 [Escherichia coli]|nr:hypothetical protein E8R51_21685 [Escherichia coli]
MSDNPVEKVETKEMSKNCSMYYKAEAKMQSLNSIRVFRYRISARIFGWFLPVVANLVRGKPAGSRML